MDRKRVKNDSFWSLGEGRAITGNRDIGGQSSGEKKGARRPLGSNPGPVRKFRKVKTKEGAEGNLFGSWFDPLSGSGAEIRTEEGGFWKTQNSAFLTFGISAGRTCGTKVAPSRGLRNPVFGIPNP